MTFRPPEVDRIWLWVNYFNKMPINPVFYLLKGDYKALEFREVTLVDVRMHI